jgi:ubiquinone/menaquinone biosynthesis C-methylase UbiE
MFFLRKSSLERLPVSMTGVRMGERALQLGVDDPSLVGAIAAKVGLSGHAAVAARNEEESMRARGAAEGAGALIDIHVTPFSALPFEEGSFDLVVVHTAVGAYVEFGEQTLPAILGEVRRVLRPGGRLVVIEGGSGSGMLKKVRPKVRRTEASSLVAAVGAGGFRAARLLAEHEGYRFTEGLK